MSSASVRSVTCFTPGNGGTASSCIRRGMREGAKPRSRGQRRSCRANQEGGTMQRLIPAALAATLAAALLAVGAAPAAPPGNHYTVTPLASDVPGLAPATDSNLQNTWGLARSDTSPWWIANNGTASTSVYTGAGVRVDIGGLPAQGVPGDPTGAVFSGIAGQFQVGTTASPGTLGTSNFIFDGEDGTISAWRIGSTAALVTVPSSGAVYDLDGKFLGRVARRGQLNAPWGLAMAPGSFGRFGGDLLVGNFGDGQINAYAEMPNGHFEHRGTLHVNHRKLSIDGLWALEFGHSGANGDQQTLFFTAGINDEADGLFGTIKPAS